MTTFITHRALRGVVALAAASLLIAGCSSAEPAGSGPTGAVFGSLPTSAGEPKAGGVVTVAQAVGLAPNNFYPNRASSDSPFSAQQAMFKYLYAAADVGSTQSINADLSLAELPKASDEGKTFTIKMKDNYKWSDGKQVNAADVIFSIDLIKAAIAESPANYYGYVLGGFPENVVSMTATDTDTLELTLKDSTNPDFFLNNVASTLIPLPSTAWNIAAAGGEHLDSTVPANATAIYNYLSKQGREQSTFASNPLWQVVNGPFRLQNFEAATGGYTLVPNDKYTGPSPSKVEAMKFLPFTSTSAMMNQLKAGALSVGALDASFASEVTALKQQGYNSYGRPGPTQFNPVVINFKNTTNNFDKVIAQLYVRQALQHLIDQPGYIKSRGIYGGAGAPSYTIGQVGTRFAPSFGDKAPYPFDPAAAAKLLTDNGWTAGSDGSRTCTSPGTGTGNCGAGIPAGQTLSFNLLYASSPEAIANRNTAFISAAKQVGITITGEAKSLNFLYENADNNAAPAFKDQWAMADEGSFNASTYPTASSYLKTGASFNLGQYSDPRADALMTASERSSDPNALVAETTYLGENLPYLFMPNPANIAVWKSDISGPPASFANITRYGLGLLDPQLWYFQK
ncbi:ABC transporter substrate-binding protein [Arthrobacter sp. GMC3]|uniref:ABC transporter substrate-binding protein n=1 Tax=Arthrobacter sp. GMC3 TaxID=2058894 RepID=UPI0015E32483|nr:ABC transporter substrate-binding protein [Arthrobacter sp. GMC3]